MKRRVPFEYVVAAIVLGSVIFTAWNTRTPYVELDYSDFKRLVQAHRVSEVHLGAASIDGEVNLATIEMDLPDHVRRFIGKAPDTQSISFVTDRIEDPALVQELLVANVRFSGKDDTNWLGVLLSWIATVLVFMAA